MKKALKWVLTADFILGIIAFDFAAWSWADSELVPKPTLAVTEVTTPVPISKLHRHAVKKSNLVGDADSVSNATLVAVEASTPETTAISHDRRSKNTKSTAEAGQASPLQSVATPIVDVKKAATRVPDYEFNAVIITGTKTKLKVLDSPAAVSVVPRSKIDQKKITYIDDALTDLPGVQVSRVAEGGQSATLTMRGIPGYDKNLVLLDGLTINQPANQRVFWNVVPTQLVDHVEIVRGPFSALYGKSALGGVVNIITKEPEGQSYNLSENWDSTNTRVTSANYQKKISNLFSFYLGAENTTVNGYTYHQFIQVKPTTGTSAQTVTGFVQTTNSTGTTLYNIGETARTVLNNNNISSKVYFKPAQDQIFSLLFNYSFWDQPTNNQTGSLGETWLTDVNTGAQVKSGTVSLAGTGKIVKLTESQFLTAPGHNSLVLSDFRYRGKLKEDLWVTANFSYTAQHANVDNAALPTTITATTGAASDTENSPSWGGIGDIQADYKFYNHHVILGFAYDYSKFGLIKRYWPFWGDIDNYIDYSGSLAGVVEINEALYVQDEWKLLPSLSAFLGARLDDWTRENEFIVSTTTGVSTSYPDRTVLNFSPKLSLVYKLGEKGSLRTSIGKSFNPPVPSKLIAGGTGATATSVTLPNPDLGPEKDTAWEVGGEYNLPTKTTVSTTYFNNYLTDLIYTNSIVTGTLTTSQSINAGAARIRGIEGEISQKIFQSLDAFVNYTRIESKFTKNDAVPASIGKRIPYISRDVINLGVDFRWKHFDIAPSGTFHSKQYLTADNSDTVNGVQGAYDSYTTLSTKVLYHFNGGNVSAGVNNIFNARYYLVYLNPGRTYNVGAQFNVF